MNGSLQSGEHVIEVSLKSVEIFSIFSSVISLVLGIVAIVLSILFYKMSEKSSKDVENSARDIDSNVKKLEMMFEKMYADTFGMVKETVSDMRQYVYKNNGNKGEDTFSDEIELRTKEVINQTLEGIHSTTLNKDQVKDLVLDLIEKSKDVEQDIKTDSYIEKIKNVLRGKNLTFFDLAKEIYGQKPESDEYSDLFNALKKMTNNKIIEDPFDYGDDELPSIRFNSIIKLRNNK
ncbi:hypothetical protein IMZ78_22065 [Bacillus anthracis]|uniref:hypothetical protein n=1 Tax=Bacillus cereus group TaxID=86661 RepID=UPI000BEF9F6A|nr:MULTISPECIES: hypothetical protein [Bacillus cereus group]MBE3644980.1 hypothetical protein [Bacillus anthracis]PEI78304.1 hypothetical protein CN905_11840 [Bacillus wiedmannii]PHD98183.1 hypothetical protein COF56_24875 [Bacillus wiedmannii]